MKFLIFKNFGCIKKYLNFIQHISIRDLEYIKDVKS